MDILVSFLKGVDVFLKNYSHRIIFPLGKNDLMIY